MTDARHTFASGFSGRASRVVRDILAALIALAVVGLVIFLAAMLTAAFLVVAYALASHAFATSPEEAARAANAGGGDAPGVEY